MRFSNAFPLLRQVCDDIEQPFEIRGSQKGPTKLIQRLFGDVKVVRPEDEGEGAELCELLSHDEMIGVLSPQWRCAVEEIGKSGVKERLCLHVEKRRGRLMKGI